MDWTHLARGGALLLVGAALIALQGVARAATPTDASEALRKLAQRRIFFAHQSVGGNILEGLQQAAVSSGVNLRVVEAPAAGAPAAPGTVLHALVGDNGQPDRKLDDFERLLDGGLAAQVDVALVKFCYVDVDARTDVRPLFERYLSRLAALRARHPGVTFVHVTVPITVVQSGPRAWVKRVLGRAPWGHDDNVRREAFNALLRQEYAGKEPLFDLAEVEATRPDGRRETYEANGTAIPRLVGAYTDDGGHLNAAGRAHVASAFAAFLASLSAAPEAPSRAAQAAP